MLTFTVLSGFVFGLVAPALVQTFKARSGWAIAALPMALFVYLVSQFPNVANGQSIRAAWAWVPSLGLTLSFRLDGLGLLFALLISGIGALVMVYAGDYLHGRDDVGRFFVYLLMFMAAMLLGPGVLFALSVLLGLWPWLANGLAAQASSAILGETAQVNLALWHGLNTPLMLSLMALAAGTGLYVVYGRAVHILAARQCSLGKPGKPSRFVLYWFLDESCESSDKSPVFG